MNTPEAALVTAYWLHMLAAAAWMGGLAVMTLFMLPAAAQMSDHKQKNAFLEKTQHRLDLTGWLSLGMLTVSGLIQMSASAQYEGFLAFDNRWSLAILIKHLFFGLVIALSAVMTWYVLPGIRKAAFKVSKGLDAPEAARLEKLNRILLWANLGLGLVVLGLTALARVSA